MPMIRLHMICNKRETRKHSSRNNEYKRLQSNETDNSIFAIDCWAAQRAGSRAPVKCNT